MSITGDTAFAERGFEQRFAAHGLDREAPEGADDSNLMAIRHVGRLKRGGWRALLTELRMYDRRIGSAIAHKGVSNGEFRGKAMQLMPSRLGRGCQISLKPKRFALKSLRIAVGMTFALVVI